MELRQYVQIVLRRWWIPILLILIVVAVTLPELLSPASRPYQALMRFSVGVSPEPRTGAYYTYDHYYTWLASEYLVDDLAEIIKSQVFARAVSDYLATEGIKVPAGAISGSTEAGKLHRILRIVITWPREQELYEIAEAAAIVLQEQSHRFLTQLGSENAEVHLIDPPVVYEIGPGLRERLDLPIRIFVAGAVGIALAFLSDYLDESVRNRQEVEAMGLDVLAEIPNHSSRWRFWQ
jgi:capsular polysaccharide biosynthesis protein